MWWLLAAADQQGEVVEELAGTGRAGEDLAVALRVERDATAVREVHRCWPSRNTELSGLGVRSTAAGCTGPPLLLAEPERPVS